MTTMSERRLFSVEAVYDDHLNIRYIAIKYNGVTIARSARKPPVVGLFGLDLEPHNIHGFDWIEVGQAIGKRLSEIIPELTYTISAVIDDVVTASITIKVMTESMTHLVQLDVCEVVEPELDSLNCLNRGILALNRRIKGILDDLREKQKNSCVRFTLSQGGYGEINLSYNGEVIGWYSSYQTDMAEKMSILYTLGKKLSEIIPRLIYTYEQVLDTDVACLKLSASGVTRDIYIRLPSTNIDDITEHRLIPKVNKELTNSLLEFISMIEEVDSVCSL